MGESSQVHVSYCGKNVTHVKHTEHMTDMLAYVYIYIRIYIHMYIHIYMYVYMHVFIFTRIFIVCVYPYMHVY